jgi:Putative transposase
MERLRKADKDLVYRCAKQHSEPGGDRRTEQRGARADELTLTPLELINRIAALVPPPRTHRHHYYGALAPNSPLREAVTALAQAASSQLVKVPSEPATAGGNVPTQSEPAPLSRSAAQYLWAVLIARIYEVFPLLCPLCGGQMRIIAFITHSADIRHMLSHIGVQYEPRNIAPARGPPLWEGCDAQKGEGAQVEPDWDLAAQPAPASPVFPKRWLRPFKRQRPVAFECPKSVPDLVSCE